MSSVLPLVLPARMTSVGLPLTSLALFARRLLLLTVVYSSILLIAMVVAVVPNVNRVSIGLLAAINVFGRDI